MKLKDYLKAKSITQTKFAKELDLPRITITQYVNGKRIPRQDFMQKIHEITKGMVSYGDWYNQIDKQNIKLNELTIPSNSNNLEETIMKFFNLEKNKEAYIVKQVANNYNFPEIEASHFVLVDTENQNLATGYYMFCIDQEDIIFKVVDDFGKKILVNNVSKKEFDQSFEITGKIVGSISIKSLD